MIPTSVLLRYRTALVNAAIMAVSFLVLSGVIGFYAEKLGAAFNDSRYYMAFGQRIYPPITFTSAELGALFATIAVWVWVFIWIGLADIMLEAAQVSEPIRNRFGEDVQPGIVRFMWTSGAVLVTVFFSVFFILYLH